MAEALTAKRDTRPIWVLDCETDPFAPGRLPLPFMWCIFDGTRYHLFESESAGPVLKFLRRKKVIVYAHNGGKFDYHQSDFLEHLEPGQEVMVINGRLSRFNIGLCEFRDSWNIIPVPLAAYKKTVIDYRIFERDVRNRKENKAAIVSYLKDDCFNLFELVLRHVEEFGRKLTQAGSAMKYYADMEKANAEDFKVPQSDAPYFDELKPYYYGGRVQCFRTGIIATDFEVVDITSAYPRAMLEHHPFGLKFLSADNWIGNVRGTDFLDVECTAPGCFPLRDEAGGLDFPNDVTRRTYQVTGWEYLTAKELGLINDARVRRLTRHLEQRNFKQFITHFWERRKVAKAQNDVAGNLLAKLAMNSLYGKFAADPRNYGVFSVHERGSVEGSELAGTIGPYDLRETPLPFEQMRFYNIATAASITGWVRAYLMRAMRACDGVLYCDTDSVAAEKCNVPRGTALGEWSSEGFFDRAYIAGKKLYAFRRTGKLKDGESRWKVRTKGVRLSHEELRRVASGGEVEFTPQVPTYSVHTFPKFVKRKIRRTI